MWTVTWKIVKAYENIPKGESPQQPLVSCSACYTNTSCWCPDFFPFAIPPTPLKLNTTGFSLKIKILSTAFWTFAFFFFCFFHIWQTISVHSWSFKASTLFEFQGKWKNNVKAWRRVASNIYFSFTFCKSKVAYHPELRDMRETVIWTVKNMWQLYLVWINFDHFSQTCWWCSWCAFKLPALHVGGTEACVTVQVKQRPVWSHNVKST